MLQECLAGVEIAYVVRVGGRFVAVVWGRQLADFGLHLEVLAEMFLCELNLVLWRAMPVLGIIPLIFWW